MPEYVELRCRSAFSFLDGASLPEELVARARELGQRALALADTDGLYGAPRFYKAAMGLAEAAAPEAAPRGADRRDPAILDQWVQGWPLKPLLGAELSLDDGSRLLALVENRAGYRNLARLITRSREDKPRPPRGKPRPCLSLGDLAAHRDGLVLLSGGAEGAIGRALDRGDSPAAARALGELVERFGAGQIYIELQRHLEPTEELRNQALLELARHFALPVVATNDVRYATPAGRRLHDVLVCTREHLTVDVVGRRLGQNGERYLKSAAAMTALFRDLPGAVARTVEVAERCSFTLAQLGYRFPDYPLPDGVDSAQALLSRLVWERAASRFRPLDERSRAQLARELALIGKLDLAGYFLIVWDLVEHCRARGILAQGRGSAANSAVCFALGITSVDPVKRELLFERFLSEERGEWPDIDLDLPSGERREEVIQYVYRRYGAHGAAMTANVITYRPKLAVRDVGRALGFAEEELGRLSKLLSTWGFHDPQQTIAAQVRASGLAEADERVRLLVELSTALLNLPRHLGQHSGGMIIAHGRLDEVVPLEPASMAGRVVVQWDKDDCADLGIVKVDLLGLGMMAALQEAVPLIREHEGIELDYAHLPADDPAIYRLLQTADTVGVFQVESRAQMATLPRMRPENFYDIVIEVAIIRPGPIVGDLLHPYLRRRAGRERPDPLHPTLAKVLDRTLGVPLFQEQLMRVAMIAAGFTGGQAEELRRAMGFKRSAERMAEIEHNLRAGMARNGIDPVAQDKIVKSITAFALYGFPESHAFSFAQIVYSSCYLKAHHPAAFYTTLLNNWPMGFYHPASLVRDAQQHGLEVRPVDVARSAWPCTIEAITDGEEGRAGASPGRRALAMRIGLRYVRGLGEAAARRLEAARAARPFSSVAEVAARAELTDPELTALAEVGAFAGLGRTRRAALWQVAAFARSGPLFTRPAGAADDEGEPLDEMSEREELAADYRRAGLSTGRHPLALRRAALTRAGVVAAGALATLPHGARVRVAGLVIVRQRPGTAKGFFFLTLEDETGLANAIVTPAHFEAHRPLLVSAPALVVEGRLQRQDGTVSVKADRFLLLDEAGAPSHDFH